MLSKDSAIRVTQLSKCYNIYNQPQDRLKQSIYPRIQSLLRRKIRAYYREFWALKNISFEVKKGETIGIIGRNGCGKSTLLQLICGTLTPTSGSVETQGRITALLELGSGFNHEFSGRENVYINGAILGLSTKEIDTRFDDIAAFADIGEFLYQPIKFYSSGMVVRLAFAVQTMLDPDILIVDEALSVGDEKFQRKCFARIDELKNQGKTILFVSHSARQIVQSCDRAIFLEKGRRLLMSDPLTVVRAYQKFIYAPPEDQTRLAQEYLRIDQNLEKFIEENPDPEPANMQTEKQLATEVMDGDYFDKGLVPQTTQVYPVQGAKIETVQILNLQGNVVNNLFHDKEYIFEVSGFFSEERESVFWSLLIQSVEGLVIGRLRYPHIGSSFDFVKTGQIFHFVCNLKMALNPGVYFISCGIWSLQEPTCMHRITDAIMFRVLPKANFHAGGLVDLSTKNPQVVITESGVKASIG